MNLAAVAGEGNSLPNIEPFQGAVRNADSQVSQTQISKRAHP